MTSQIFANIYLNEFDQFIKHTLKVKNYARYTDDFIIVSENRNYLENLLPQLRSFLSKTLKLEIHPQKVTIREYHTGVDFLGYVIFPHYRLLRVKTKRRIIRNIKKKIDAYKRGFIFERNLEQSFQSYLGVLSHANTYRLGEYLKNQYWFWKN